jgi:predicted RNA-binding Zn ribbon-like protein
MTIPDMDRADLVIVGGGAVGRRRRPKADQRARAGLRQHARPRAPQRPARRAEGLAAWLEHRGFAADGLGPADVAHAVEVREALRALLLANNGGPEARSARTPCSMPPRAARAWPRVRPRGARPGRRRPRRRARAGARRRVRRDARRPLGALKACPRDVCGWVFLDRSHANQGTWCSMRVCGNRVKAGAYYRRRTRGA